MPYHISRNNSISYCKAQPGNCPLDQDTRDHISKYSLERILKNAPVSDKEKDICLRLKSGDLSLDYTVPGEAFDPNIKRIPRPSRARPAGMTAPAWSREESGIRSLFQPGTKFNMTSIDYEVVSCDKPQVGGGEPKTDVFIAARNTKDNSVKAIKISYKMNSAEFGENKLNQEQARRILGDDYETILKTAADTLKISERKLNDETHKTYTLGYRLDLMLPKNSNPRENASYATIELDEEALTKIYSGRGTAKEDAYVQNYNANVLVKDAGVADYILFEDDYSNPQDVIDKMVPISEHVKTHPKVFIALKAVNYRMEKHRAGAREAWDGNRPLAFAVRWRLDERNQLQGRVNTDNVFDNGASFYGAEFKHLLQRSGRA